MCSVDYASHLKFVISVRALHIPLPLFPPLSGMAHNYRHRSRVVFLGDHRGPCVVGLAHWAPGVGRSSQKSRPGQTSCPQGGRLCGWMRARGRLLAGAASWARAALAASAGTTHLDWRHGRRRAQGGLPCEEGECLWPLARLALGTAGRASAGRGLGGGG